MLRCAKSSRYNVLAKYASAEPVLSQPKDRFFARLASEIFLSSLQTEFFSNLLGESLQSHARAAKEQPVARGSQKPNAVVPHHSWREFSNSGFLTRMVYSLFSKKNMDSSHNFGLLTYNRPA